jgi:hypothetical protein
MVIERLRLLVSAPKLDDFREGRSWHRLTS